MSETTRWRPMPNDFKDRLETKALYFHMKQQAQKLRDIHLDGESTLQPADWNSEPPVSVEVVTDSRLVAIRIFTKKAEIYTAYHRILTKHDLEWMRGQTVAVQSHDSGHNLKIVVTSGELNDAGKLCCQLNNQHLIASAWCMYERPFLRSPEFNGILQQRLEELRNPPEAPGGKSNA